ncbi:MAG: hypothetical protein WC477_03730 [Patescibacteria group bacterium]
MNELFGHAPDVQPEKRKKTQERFRFEPGMEVKVQQRDGAIEPGWVVEQNTNEPPENPRIILLKNIDGVDQKRSIPTSELIETNFTPSN